MTEPTRPASKQAASELLIAKGHGIIRRYDW